MTDDCPRCAPAADRWEVALRLLGHNPDRPPPPWDEALEAQMDRVAASVDEDGRPEYRPRRNR